MFYGLNEARPFDVLYIHNISTELILLNKIFDGLTYRSLLYRSEKKEVPFS